MLQRYKRDTEIVTNTKDEVVVTMDNLPPNSNVELSVAVFNTRYYGPFSQPVTIRTKQGREYNFVYTSLYSDRASFLSASKETQRNGISLYIMCQLLALKGENFRFSGEFEEADTTQVTNL